MEWMYIIVFGLALIGIAMMQPKKQDGDVKKDVVKELQSAIESFTFEMDEENEKLMRAVTGMKEQEEAERAKLNQQIVDLEIKLGRMEGRMQQLSAQVSESARAVARATESAHQRDEKRTEPADAELASVPTEAPSTASDIRARYGELFALYDQGKSIEYMAKKLNMNKGEVQLIIQLAGREAHPHA